MDTPTPPPIACLDCRRQGVYKRPAEFYGDSDARIYRYNYNFSAHILGEDRTDRETRWSPADLNPDVHSWVPDLEDQTMTTPMRQIAAEIVDNLRANGFPADGAADRQVLALAEEVGELTGAYRRWSGQARRRGKFADVEAELADVVIVAWVTATELGIVLPDTVRIPATPSLTQSNSQVLAMNVAAGAFIATHQRWTESGQTTLPTEMVDALAEVVDTAETIAAALDIDLTIAVDQKLTIIRARSWREPDTTEPNSTPEK
ncbi:hypothetical protein ACL02S_22905 [Nocardia sp. 004]|uniref:hypothetical protein n=1 Tax=Nocardia sp. 004 TaxID=3385978 RepID=UPI0039A15E9F